MQRAITVGLWRDDPVAGAFRMQPINVGYCRINIPADGFLAGRVLTIEDYAHGVQIVDLLKGDSLCFHLTPDAVDTFHAVARLVFQAHGVESFTDRRGEVGIGFVASLLSFCNLGLYITVFGRMFVFEAQVLKLGLDGKQAETMGEGRVYI